MIGKYEEETIIRDWVKNNQDINQLDVIRIMELLMKLETKMKFIDQEQLLKLAKPLQHSGYGEYLEGLLDL